MQKGVFLQNAKLIVGILVAAALIVGGLMFARQGDMPDQTRQTEKVSFEVGQKAPDFTLKDFAGKDISLSEFYGKKAVVLDFWAAWCPFCVEEMPVLEKAQQVYEDNLVMIGVHRTDSGEGIETGKKFADERGVTYLLVQGTEDIYDASTKGVKGMPVAVFIDKAGIVHDVKIGPKTAQEIEQKITSLLQ